MGLIIIGLTLATLGYVSLNQLHVIEEPLRSSLPESISSIERETHLDIQAQNIRYYDEVLTQSARNFALTSEKKWVDRYKEAEPLLDSIIKDTISHGDDIEKEFFTKIDGANKKLVSMEYESINLVENGESTTAIKILDGDDYRIQKEIYQSALNEYIQKRSIASDLAFDASSITLNQILSNTHSLVNDITQFVIFTIFLVILIGVGFSFLILFSITNPIRRLKKAAQLITMGQKNVEFPKKADNEILDLSNSFQLMIESLNHSKELHAATEIKYKKLYNESPEMYRTVDLQGFITDCNDAYLITLGYSKEEVIGRHIDDFVPEAQKEIMANCFKKWLSSGVVQNEKVFLRKKDGTVIPCLLSASTNYDEFGKKIGSNTSIRNMIDLHNAQKEIEDLRLKRLSVIGELTARIAHDLRNPLSILKNSIEMLEMSYKNETDPSKKAQWDRIDRAVFRISHQVEDVLDYVRASPLKMSYTSLNSLLDNAVSRILVPDSIFIHKPSKDNEIYCDSDKLEVVFVNLLMNAIQAMEHNGEIFINSSEADDKNICIVVQDSGPGVPIELRDKIFDPLFTTRQIGTGLGLPSCKNIIERHNGTIELDIIEGKGARFVITIPKIQKLISTS